MTLAAMRHLSDILPDDWAEGTFVARMDFGAGPTPVVFKRDVVEDVSHHAPTVADLLERYENAESLPAGRPVGRIDELAVAPTWGGAEPRWPRLLPPLDLQCVKAAGVTFATSTLERVIEERAGGDQTRAATLRADLADRIGNDLQTIRPGSEAAGRLKQVLIAEGFWSQYLEVAIGPDAEVFTKAPVLSSVGWGDAVGVRADSHWNNPEPEVVLICDSQGRIRGACLGNDVNLRDFEGRSALLLGKAKDNNASCAVGPALRLFDAAFSLDDVRHAVVELEVQGSDGFALRGESRMDRISRDPTALVAQTIGPNHQYPDGFALFLGTLFAPTQDRDGAGLGFTHHVGDRVVIRSPKLGVLENVVVHCPDAPPWRQGIRALMENLAGRGLLTPCATSAAAA